MSSRLIDSDDVQRLHERLDCIAKDVAAIREGNAASFAMCPQHRAAIERCEVTLHGQPGNGGNPGLIGRVVALESFRQSVRVGLWCLWGAVLAIATVALDAILGRR